MASRSARSPRSKAVDDYDAMGGVGIFLSRHRKVVGGLTAFIVAFSYVGANAIWYQPHAHGGAFFTTRPAPMQGAADNDPAADDELETVIRLEREEEDMLPGEVGVEVAALPLPDAAPRRQQAAPTEQAIAEQAPATSGGDPVVRDVQRILAELNLYSGEVDGLTGPQTRSAIENYRKIVGLSASAEIDDQLLNQLGATPRSASSAPPLPEGSPGTDMIETSSAGAEGDPMVMRIQAGLKAFGNEGIEIDGKVGSRTKSAILEFQSLFGLPETGMPDETLYAKMQEIGLTN